MGLLIGDELAAGGLALCGFDVGTNDADIVGTELSSWRGDGVVVDINVVAVVGDGLISNFGAPVVEKVGVSEW